jgi:hypothetical protein
MAMIVCKECGKDVSSTAKYCPGCGAKNSRTKWWLWVPFGFVTVFLIFGSFRANTPEGKEKSRARDVIANCWIDHERQSLDSSARRFAASTCEQLEKQFREKYGFNP